MSRSAARGVLIERSWGSSNWRGPGHCGLYHDGNRDLIVYGVYAARPTP